MKKNLHTMFSTIILLLLLYSLTGPSVSTAADKTEPVVSLSSRLELFVDSLIIGRMIKAGGTFRNRIPTRSRNILTFTPEK